MPKETKDTQQESAKAAPEPDLLEQAALDAWFPAPANQGPPVNQRPTTDVRLDNSLADLIKAGKEAAPDWQQSIDLSKGIERTKMSVWSANSMINDARYDIEQELGQNLSDSDWENPDFMRNALKDKPYHRRIYREVEIRQSRVNQVQSDLTEQFDKIYRPLEQRINAILHDAELPDITLTVEKLAGPPTHRGTYGLGSGIISFDPIVSQPGRPRTVETMAHEIKHSEQDALIIRTFASEQAGGRSTLADEDKTAIRERYEKALKLPLRPEWLEKVLTMPDALTVTEQERERAYRLIGDEAKRQKLMIEVGKIKRQANDLIRARDYVQTDTGAADLVDMLRIQDETGLLCRTLFGTEDLPGAVRKLARYRNDIDAHKRPASDWNERAAKRTLLEGMTFYAGTLSGRAHDLYISQFHEQEAVEFGGKAKKLFGPSGIMAGEFTGSTETADSSASTRQLRAPEDLGEHRRTEASSDGTFSDLAKPHEQLARRSELETSGKSREEKSRKRSDVPKGESPSHLGKASGASSTILGFLIMWELAKETFRKGDSVDVLERAKFPKQ